MRILQVINSIAPSRGGPTYVVANLSRALAELGAEVHILSTRADLDAEGEAEVRRTLKDVRLTLVPSLGPARLEFSPGWLGALARAAQQCDVAHIHTVFTYPVAVAPLLLRTLRRPYVVRPAGTLDSACIALRSTRSKRLAISGYVRRNLNAAASVQVTSSLEEAEIRSLAPAARTALVELGVDVSSETPRPPSSGRRIGSLGRIHPIKRLDVLIRALLHLPGTELVLAGAGDPRDVRALRELAAGLGVAERVQFLGHLEGPEKRRFLEECNVLAFPSLHESFGVAVVEALAAGRPVVVSPAVAIADQIARAGAGRVEPAEPQAFAAGISDLLTRGAEVTRNAYALAQSRWRWDQAARRTLDLYRQLT
jgi:glycosyltransferase involved in cell wall biosynthesis